MNKRAVTTLKTGAFQEVRNTIPNKLTASSRLISTGIKTAVNNPIELNAYFSQSERICTAFLMHTPLVKKNFSEVFSHFHYRTYFPTPGSHALWAVLLVMSKAPMSQLVNANTKT